MVPLFYVDSRSVPVVLRDATSTLRLFAGCHRDKNVAVCGLGVTNVTVITFQTFQIADSSSVVGLTQLQLQIRRSSRHCRRASGLVASSLGVLLM